MRIAPVVTLLQGCCPPAIPRFVVRINIDAVERCAFGAFSHVFEKVRELLPALTDSDASPTVVAPVLDARADPAARFHADPRAIGGRLVQVMAWKKGYKWVAMSLPALIVHHAIGARFARALATIDAACRAWGFQSLDGDVRLRVAVQADPSQMRRAISAREMFAVTAFNGAGARRNRFMPAFSTLGGLGAVGMSAFHASYSNRFIQGFKTYGGG